MMGGLNPAHSHPLCLAQSLSTLSSQNRDTYISANDGCSSRRIYGNVTNPFGGQARDQVAKKTASSMTTLRARFLGCDTRMSLVS